VQGLDLGADDWLILPLEANELRARARNQIRRKVCQDRLRTDPGTILEAAMIDPLTGLWNQRYLMQHLRELLERGREHELAVLMIDVDDFTSVNEEFGHRAGDAALRLIADVLRGQMRALDSLARYGGEEFVLVTPDSGADDAAQTAGRLLSAIAATPFRWSSGSPFHLTASIGIACSGAHCDTGEALLHAAEDALQEAKRQGPNRVGTAAPVPWRVAAT
jgi:two-component system cell cycle response regulator